MPSVGEFEVVLLGGTHKLFALSRSTGIYVLATMLRDEGYTVQCIDYLVYIVENFTPEQQRELLGKFLSTRTRVVGLSTTLLACVEENIHYRWWGMKPQKMKDFIDIIREMAPNAKIVVGGSSVRDTEEEFISTFYPGWVDYWVIGQGESTFLAVVNHIKYEDPLITHNTHGITVVKETDYPFNNFSRSRIEWDKSALVQPNETLPMEIARGCVFSCSFCSYQLIGKKWGEFTRTRDVIRDELIRNYETNGTFRYILTDDTINDSLDKVKFLHEIFTSLPFKVEWAAYVRLDLITKFPEMAQLLYESGLKAAMFGIETMHHEAGKTSW